MYCTIHPILMFAIERYHFKKPKIQAKRMDFQVGMTFEKPKIVKRRFTYREFTLLVGILVALIVAITFAIGQDAFQQVIHSTFMENPQLSSPLTGSKVKEAIMEVIF